MKGLQIALAAIGGAVVGAAAAILLAPQSGIRTRAQIRRFIRDKFPYAKESQVEEIADAIEDKIEEKMNETLETKKK